MFVVVITAQQYFAPDLVDAKGPYATPDAAERARRRIHFDLVTGGKELRMLKTYVREVGSDA